MVLLQVALDVLDIDEALKIAMDVADYVDFIEAGTPFIKKFGVKGIEKLAKELKKPIVADMKTMDTGYLETSLAYAAGAYYSTVLSVADVYTIKEALRARDEYKRGLMIDTIGLDDIVGFINILEKEKLYPDYILVHTGIDMQHQGVTPFKQVRDVDKYGNKYNFGVAGGLNEKNINQLKEYKHLKLIIVGGGITKSKNPKEAAKKLKESIYSMFTI